MNYSFSYGPRVIAGEGAANGLDAILPAGRVLFVTDEQVLGLGLADAALMGLSGRDVTVFAKVEADPSRATLEAAVLAGRDAKAVVGFGGGSPMDVAKLAAYLLGSGEKLDDIWGVGATRGAGLPLVLVPTTAGTGSEATSISIITLPGGEKRGVSSHALAASYAILDPALTVGLPRSVTSATGMDAMVHAIEAYTSAHLKNPLSDMLARRALELLSANLLAACNDPTAMGPRAAMLLGAHLAGVAFANAPVAGVHALAYPLGGFFHVPHGLSNALMMPHVLSHNMASAHTLYAELAAIVNPALAGIGTQEAAAGLVQQLQAISVAAGMPQRLRDVGVTSADLDRLAASAMLQTRLLQNNPCPIAETDARRLYEAAL
jgi:alcohol dehydrogenase class IV